MTHENYTIAKQTKKTKWNTTNTRVVRLFIKENGLVFTFGNVIESKFTNTHSYKLSLINGKFNFYLSRKNYNNLYKTNIADPNDMNSLVSRNITSKGRVASVSGFSIKSKALIMKHLKAFLKKNNIKYKHLSKNPIIMMKQLCYPGLQILNDDCFLVKTKHAGYFAKQDICKSILKNKGSTSRRLLLGLIKKNPEQFYMISTIISYLNKKYGIDYVIELMKHERANNFLSSIFESFIHMINYRIRKTKAIKEYLDDIFNKINNHQLKILTDTFLNVENNEVIRITHYLKDALRMVHDINGSIPVFNSVRDLHDKIMTIRPAKIQPKIHLVEYKYQNLLTKALIEEFLSNFKSEKYYIKFPESNLELKDWGNFMHNCVYSYSRMIEEEKYLLAGIFDKTDKTLIYNIGYSMVFHDNKKSLEINMQQVYGKYNKELTVEEKEELKNCYEGIFT